MEDEIKTTRSKRKPKPSQIPYALILLVAIIAFGFYLNSPKLVAYWIFGLAFGMVLQRSRFCFTAAFRDPVLTGGTSLTRAVLLTIALATIGFTAYSYQSSVSGLGTPWEGSVEPISVLTAIGGVLFGIGMVIAGGCASGTLMRFGEGFQLQWLSFVFFVFGSFVGAWAMGYLEPLLSSENQKVFLPDKVGWLGALLIQYAIILVIYIIALKWQEKKLGTTE